MTILIRRFYPSILLLLLIPAALQCQKSPKGGDWIAFTDPATETCGYKNSRGETVIQPGKYSQCFTERFNTYAIVYVPEVGVVAIDRQEQVLYEVFLFDNGPDEPAEGLFRIMQSGKIGYADAKTGQVVIEPAFDGAFPFENGMAKVGIGCTTEADGEHFSWTGGAWKYIDRNGQEVTPAEERKN